MPLEHANVIDIIFHDEKSARVLLVMTETRAWDGSDLRLFQLQEKINAYLSFALDGEMLEAYPHFHGKALRLQLECTEIPDARTIEFLKIVRERIAFQGIVLEVHVTNGNAEKSTCDSGCGCHSSSAKTAT